MIPDLQSTFLLKLKEEYNLAGDSQFIKVIPEKYSIVSNCFPNVENKIKSDGGDIVYGWQIWETDLIIEAEFHAIWKSTSGELIDITPKGFNCKEILFIEELTKKYEGHQVDNLRLNKTGEKLVDIFIKLFETRFQLLNKDSRKNQHLVFLNQEEEKIHESINECVVIIETSLKNKIGRRDLCLCGSGKRFKNCHEEIALRIIRK